jgi:DNA-binding Lrp family transcriptional regulator
LDEKIVDIVATPNPHKVGYGLKAIVMLKVQLPKLRELARKFAKCPDVHYLAQCTGDYNLLFWLVCPTTNELAKFINTHLALEENGIEESRCMCLKKQQHQIWNKGKVQAGECCGKRRDFSTCF